MSGNLFFYGVLMADVAPEPVRALLAGLGPGGPGHVCGRLFACADPGGCYPVLVHDPQGPPVRGMIHQAGMVDIAALDRFEGYDPADLAGSHYLRASVLAFPDFGPPVEAQAYLYNGSLTQGLEAIPHGDFARYLAETGHRPFSG